MTVAVDGTTSKGQIDNTTALTISHTATGSNRAVIVGVAFGSGDSASTCSATYGGTAMTKLGVKSTNNQTGLGFTAMFGLVAPATGAQNCVINGPSGAIGAGVTSFTGADQTTPFGTAVLAAGSKSGGSGHPAASVSSAAGDIVIDAICYGSALTGGIGNTGTLQWNEDINGDTAAGNGAGSSYSGSTTVTVGYNPTPDDFWGLVAVDVKAAGGGSTDHPGAVTPTVTATLTPAGAHGRHAAVTGTAQATATPTPHTTRGAAISATVTAGATAGPTHIRAAAVSATAAATLTPAAFKQHPAIITADATATLEPAAAATHEATGTADATATLLLSAGGQNQAAITADVTAALTPAETHLRAAAIGFTAAATLTAAAAKASSQAITANVIARLVASILGAVSRELELSLGIPAFGWETGTPTTGWRTGQPRIS